jgi:hypothetical protein
VLLIYDGPAPPRPPDCREGIVVGSGTESADELIVAEAARLAASRYPYWLVTSDRAVRAAAGPAAARTIGGGAFARELVKLRGLEATG